MADVKITNNKDQVIKEMETKIDKALEMIGLQAEGDAKLELESSPRRVDTGLLRNSITYAVSGQQPHVGSYSNDGKHDKTGEPAEVITGQYSGTIGSEQDHEVYIGTNVEYGPEIHEGRPGLDPNRFLKNAVEKNVATFRRMIEETLKE